MVKPAMNPGLTNFLAKQISTDSHDQNHQFKTAVCSFRIKHFHPLVNSPLRPQSDSSGFVISLSLIFLSNLSKMGLSRSYVIGN
jgi:hypothetical protein